VRPDLSRDLVRPGIALYGRTPLPGRGDFGLIPVMTLTGEISLVKRVARGQGVSYSHTWVAPQDTVVAVVPAGYADGVPRTLSGRFEVLVNGRRFPAVGRVCMDQFVIDLGPDGGGVAEGDLAELFGRGHAGGSTAADWADATDTIDYEILSAIRGRTVRRYVGGEA
ncbi:MAG TPA: alanine racemase C-terminal domain-containing protein, partial [Gordonia sp. (in: high G+C Gram-positive bacteria)]|nr:alanine racemase C-terminal domain-containing protein [Gordonia sp. (in: high G+C Gram-positive bacteria)]